MAHAKNRADSDAFLSRMNEGESPRQILKEKTVPEAEGKTAETQAAAESASAPEPKKKGKDKGGYPKWLMKLGKLMIKVGILLLIGVAIWTYVGELYITHDNNMYPHVKDGDLIVTYKLEPYIIGDIVMYETSRGMRVGRIIAKGGDVIDIAENGLYTVNGITPYENVFYDTLPNTSSDIKYPYTVPEGEIFVLNDMRETMTDSRNIGSISLEIVHGKLEMLVRHRGM